MSHEQEELMCPSFSPLERNLQCMRHSHTQSLKMPVTDGITMPFILLQSSLFFGVHPASLYNSMFPLYGSVKKTQWDGVTIDAVSEVVFG